MSTNTQQISILPPITLQMFINIFIDKFFKYSTKMMSGGFLTDKPCHVVRCLIKNEVKQINNLNVFLHV